MSYALSVASYDPLKSLSPATASERTASVCPCRALNSPERSHVPTPLYCSRTIPKTACRACGLTRERKNRSSVLFQHVQAAPRGRVPTRGSTCPRLALNKCDGVAFYRPHYFFVPFQHGVPDCVRTLVDAKSKAPPPFTLFTTAFSVTLVSCRSLKVMPCSVANC